MENPYSPPPSLVSSVFIDHVRAAFREPEKQVEMALVELFGRYWADLEVPFEADEVEYSVSDKAGNFSEARTWSFRGLTLFRCLVAGRSTRGVGHFIIDGQSCRLVAPGFWPSLASMGQRRAWALKRVDQAADDDSGLLNVETLEQAYDLGLMAHRAGGSPRLLDVRDPRRGTASTGWTVYVGDRKGAETVRVYDKHSEVLAKRGQAAADLIPRNRVRVELERKHVKGAAPMAWDQLADPAPYFAADCPLLAMRAGGVEPVKVGRVVRDQAEADLWALLAHCRNSYGAAIEQALWALGGGDEAAVALIGQLRRPGSKPPVPGVCEVVGGGVPDAEYGF